MPVIQNTKTGNDGTKWGTECIGKTKRTQHWFSICLNWEDVCGLNTWHTWKMTVVRLRLVLCTLGLLMIRSRRYRHFRPSHTPRWFTSTPPSRESNGSDVRQPTSSDFACSIGTDNIRAGPKASKAAEHTKHICSRPCPSLPKRFRRPTVRPVCSCLNSSHENSHRLETVTLADLGKVCLISLLWRDIWWHVHLSSLLFAKFVGGGSVLAFHA